MSHDQNFKNLIIDYPHQALDFFAPEEANGLKNARIVPIRQEQLKKRLGDRFRELDVPLLAEWPDGRREALLFVIEEETNARRFSIHRLAHYCLDLAELFETNRVAPVVIFLKSGHATKKLELGGDHQRYLEFRYLYCELDHLSAEQYMDSNNIVARLNLPNMAYPADRRVDVYARALQGLTSLESDTEKVLKYVDFIDIYADLDDNELEEYRKRYPEEAKLMSTFSQRYLQQGLEQGLEQGIEKGLEQGERKGQAQALLKLLKLKFGELPANDRERIEQADTEQLQRWLERVLTADSLEMVLAD